MKLFLIHSILFSFLQLTSPKVVEKVPFIGGQKSGMHLRKVNSIDLTYEAGCSSSRDTLKYNYTISFPTDSLRSVWVSTIDGFKAYQVSLYDETGLGLAFHSSQDMAVDVAPPVQTKSKQVLVKAWVIRSQTPRSSIIINWEETK